MSILRLAPLLGFIAFIGFAPLPSAAQIEPRATPVAPTRDITAPRTPRSQALTATATTAVAAPTAGTPSISGPLPTSATSYPFNASGRDATQLELASYGYVEQEFVVRGTANVYGWQNGSLTVGSTASGPYTTRILVRRPATQARFSGTVVVELLNPSYGFDLDYMWAALHERLLFHDAASVGDAWVGITVSPNSIAALQRFDGARYAGLSMANPVPLNQTCTDLPPEFSPTTEQGLEWDIVSQVGALLRTGSGPMSGLQVQKVYATGYSRGANDLVTYANAFGKSVSLPGGAPIYDGYLIASAVGGPSTISQCATWYPPGDQHSIIQPNRVPIVRVNTASDFGWWFGAPGSGISAASTLNRRPDRDGVGDQFRLYEIPGGSHLWLYPEQFFPDAASLARIGAGPVAYTCGEPNGNDFPLQYFLRGALVNLDRWSRTGAAPVRADRIALNNPGTPTETTVTDQWGNARLGVRSPNLDVPRATYVPYSSGAGCGAWGHVQPFAPSLLAGMYPGSNYVNQVTAATLKLLGAGWVTESDARSIIQAAGST